MKGPLLRRLLFSVACLIAVGATGCHVFPLVPVGADQAEREVTPGTPGKYAHRVSQFVFLSDFEVQKNLPIFRELANLREQVYKELQLPTSNTIVQVFLFEDKERYERFMQLKHPVLPKRGAFFVAQPRRLGGVEDMLVYTYWGDRIQQDLRHELTHALLHCVLKDVPLWLDEGLAEFFEVPPGWNGVNMQHLEQLRGKTKFDLDRLEQLTDVQQMNPSEYREAWAWTHLMLRGNPAARQALITYLQDLRGSPRPGTLRPRLEKVHANLDASLQHHLAGLGVAKARSTK
jgi:hypothetical protein